MNKSKGWIASAGLLMSLFSVHATVAIEDMAKNLQLLYMWEQVAATCQVKAPTELRQEWSLMEITLKVEVSLWEEQISSQLRYVGKIKPEIESVFSSLKTVSDLLAPRAVADMSCDSNDKNYVIRIMVSDPMFERACQRVLEASRLL